MGQESVKDPVCGMTIQPADGVETVEHEGTTYYFCSRSCAESFREAPGDYV
jgi:YHS domain-containing protein